MSFLSDYPVSASEGRYNELLAPDGSVRPCWRTFVSAVEEEGFDKLPFYADQALRFAEAETADRSAPAVCGPIPFMLSAEDFETIARGLAERAAVLNEMLRDLYGEQKLISSGVLPPGVVFGHPSYFPALKGIKPADGIFLSEYAADVERAPDGTFWVTADHAQCPTGTGLTVKNRLILSRVMPKIYARTAPRRVIDFFRLFYRRLAETAPTKEKYRPPRIVLMGGGTEKERSYEDAFFARTLGISVVSPSDLTVREDRVFLKNVDGLKRADVILRRIDDGSCDPLELTGSSVSGVAGLVEALRAGKVAVVNPPGTGTAEIPALKAFIHGVARYFNGKDMLLPSLAAWWCGQDKERRYVSENAARLIIRDINGRPVTPGAEELNERPELFTAEERVLASVSPVLTEKGLRALPVRLRFHVIRSGGEYRVMEGGTAFARDENGRETALDIWIPRTHEEKLRQGVILPSEMQSQIKPVRRTFDLTSGTADNMFWLGRNLERSEELARLLRAVFRRFAESPEPPAPEEVATLMSVLALGGHLPFYDFTRKEDFPQFLSELKETITSPDYGYGLRALFSRMREAADALRDRLSSDTWEIFMNLPRLLPETGADDKAVLNCLNAVILQQNALSGLIRENMTREHSWRFLEIGRRLERGMQVLMLMNGIGFCAKNGFRASLDAVLEVLDSRMTYRARYMSVPTVPLVFDLLVCDDTNPRSLIYQVLKLRQNVSVMERESKRDGLFEQESAILEDMLSVIKNIDVMTFAVKTGGNALLSPDAAEKPDELQRKLTAFSDTLTLSCFVHAASTRQGPAYNKGRMK